MDTGTFAMVIFVIIIIVGAYLILTESVQGTSKTILIVFIVIITIALILNLGLFSTTVKILDSPVLATGKIKPLVDYNYTPSYSLSTWIYVNDWNLNNGKDKEIITRTLGPNSVNNPKIYLDPYKNWLNIEFHTGGDPSHPRWWRRRPQKQVITVRNINTQKWVNITCCFSDTNVDTYINGKLVDTTIPTNGFKPRNLYFPNIKTGDKQLNFNICNNSTGFSGFISNTYYYPYMLTPQDAWDIYKKGFSNNIFGNLLNKYNASFTLYDNQTQVAQYYIM
jgi:hypothetical protein